jgi:hypothetical protein
MDDLQSCYFCGTALDAPVRKYPAVPPDVGETDRTVSLCPTCRRKYRAVVDAVLAAVREDTTAGPSESAPGVASGTDTVPDAGVGDENADEDDAPGPDTTTPTTGDEGAATDAEADERDRRRPDPTGGATGLSDPPERVFEAFSEDSREHGFDDILDDDDDDDHDRETIFGDIDLSEDGSVSDAADEDATGPPEPDGAVTPPAEDGTEGGTTTVAADASDGRDPQTVEDRTDDPTEVDPTRRAGPTPKEDDDRTRDRPRKNPTGGDSAKADPAEAPGSTPGAGDEDDATGDDGTHDLTIETYNTVIKLLQNREFPVERPELVTVATSAYDLSESQVDAAIEAIVEREAIVADESTLVRENPPGRERSGGS